MHSSVEHVGAGHSAGRAIWTICLGVFCLVVNDALAKGLAQFYAPLQIVFVRNLIAIPMIVALVTLVAGPRALWTRHLGLHALRGLLMVGGAYAFIVGLKVLPLAEATSLIFAAPVFITALSVPLLGEHVGWRRWTAVLAGFVGVLIIVRPGEEAFQPASLLVLGTAFLYALAMICARRINAGESGWTMMFYVVLFPMLFAGVFVVPTWQTPDASHLPHFVAIAVFGTLGMTLISQAFRLASASVVAPFDYTALIWASLIGWLVWGEIPGMWTYAGALVIIASGVYIALRETEAKSDMESGSGGSATSRPAAAPGRAPWRLRRAGRARRFRA